MDDAGTDLAGRLALVLAVGNGSVSEQDGVEFGRALADLADRIETAVQVLRDLVDLVNPQGLPYNLHLTPRELEILALLGEGLGNMEIAKRCWISENTVKFHLKNLFKKLGVRDRGQAMMMARVVQRRIEHVWPRRQSNLQSGVVSLPRLDAALEAEPPSPRRPASTVAALSTTRAP